MGMAMANKISDAETLNIVKEAIKYAVTKGFNSNSANVFFNIIKPSTTSHHGFPIEAMLTYPEFYVAFYGNEAVGSNCGKKKSSYAVVDEKRKKWQEEQGAGEATWAWLEFEEENCTHMRTIEGSENACEPVLSSYYHKDFLYGRGMRTNLQTILKHTRDNIPGYVPLPVALDENTTVRLTPEGEAYVEQILNNGSVTIGVDYAQSVNIRITSGASQAKNAEGEFRIVTGGVILTMRNGRYQTSHGYSLINTNGTFLTSSEVESITNPAASTISIGASGGAGSGGSGGFININGRPIAGTNVRINSTTIPDDAARLEAQVFGRSIQNFSNGLPSSAQAIANAHQEGFVQENTDFDYGGVNTVTIQPNIRLSGIGGFQPFSSFNDDFHQ